MNWWCGLPGVRGAAAAAHLSFADDAKGVIKLFDMRRRQKSKKEMEKKEKKGEKKTKEGRKVEGRNCNAVI